MILDLLFHWSPRENREFILRDGLHPYSRPCVHSGGLAYPYICLSPSPSWAWGHSADMDWVGDIEEWDLWQVRLGQHDDVDILGSYGPEIGEVRVRNAIPADRIWWVAMREPMSAIEYEAIPRRKRR